MADCALPGCDRPSPDAAVCAGCGQRLSARLSEVAGLWPELETTVARQGRSGDPTPRAGHPAPAQPIRPGLGDPRDDQQAGWPSGLPVDLAASEVADAVRNTVTTWARVIVEETGADPPTAGTAALLRWLARRCEWIRHQPWAVEAVDELGSLPGLIWRAVDRRRTERRYLGPCDVEQPGGHCKGELYGRAGAAEVTCPACGIEHQVPERERWLARIVADRCYTAGEIAGAYPHVRADRIRQWAARGQIAQHGRDRLGRGLYRLGDVLELASRAPGQARQGGGMKSLSHPNLLRSR